MLALLKALRPNQWIKNLIVAGPLIFSLNVFHQPKLLRTLLAFALYCALASAVYLLNDIVDRENDRRHPVKRNRPIASGAVSVPVAALLCLLLAAGGLVGCYLTDQQLTLILGGYLINNILYTFWIKHVVLLDVMSLSFGFVLRVIGGAVVINAPASEWLIMCTLLLAMFLGFAKRRAEITLLDEGADSHRRVLDHYSAYLLDQMIIIVASATTVCYALYTVSPHTVQQFGTARLIYTVPFVLYGLFRYLYLVQKKDGGGDPTRVFVTDLPTLLNVLLWLIVCSAMIYWKKL